MAVTDVIDSSVSVNDIDFEIISTPEEVAVNELGVVISEDESEHVPNVLNDQASSTQTNSPSALTHSQALDKFKMQLKRPPKVNRMNSAVGFLAEVQEKKMLFEEKKIECSNKLEAEKLQIEKDKLRLEKKKYKREYELKKYEIDKRMELDLRKQEQEERIKRYELDLKYKTRFND